MNMENSFFLLSGIIFLTFGIRYLRHSKLHCLRNKPWLRARIRKLYDLVVYNMLIRFVLESYLDYTLIVLIALYSPNYKYFGEAVSYLLTFLSAMIILPFPMILYAASKRYQFKFKNKSFIKHYGSVFFDLKHDDRWAVLYQCIFCIRRLSLSMAAVMLNNLLIF